MQTRAELNRQPLLDTAHVIYGYTNDAVPFDEAVRPINAIQNMVWQRYPETRVTGEEASTRQLRRAIGASATWELWRHEGTTESTRLALLCQSIASGVLGFSDSGLGFSLKDSVRAAEEPIKQSVTEAAEEAAEASDSLHILQNALLAFIDVALAANEVGKIDSHNFEWIMDTLRALRQPYNMQPVIDKLRNSQVQWNYWYDIARDADKAPHPVAEYLFDKHAPSKIPIELRLWLLECAENDVDHLNNHEKDVPLTNVTGWNRHLKVLHQKLADSDFDPLRYHAREQLNARNHLHMPIEDNEYWAWKQTQQEARIKKEKQDKEQQEHLVKVQEMANEEAKRREQERIKKEARDLVAAAYTS